MMIPVVRLLLFLSPLASKAVTARPMDFTGRNVATDRNRFGGTSNILAAQNWPAGSTNAGGVGANVASNREAASSLVSYPEGWSNSRSPLSLARSHEISSAPSRDLDKEDFEFLDSLARDLASNPSRTDHDLVVSAQTLPFAWSVSPPSTWPPLADWHEHPKAIFDSRYYETRLIRANTIRHRIRWPGPKLLPRLGYWRPMETQGVKANFVFGADQTANLLRDHINLQFFANKLKWVDAEAAWGTSLSRWRSKMPLTRVSQRLPSLYTTSHDGKVLRIYMTETNLQTTPGSAIRGTPLEHTPLFTFWSVPQFLSAEKNEMTLLGVGYLNVEDNEAVDQRLQGVIEAALQPPRAHV